MLRLSWREVSEHLLSRVALTRFLRMEYRESYSQGRKNNRVFFRRTIRISHRSSSWSVAQTKYLLPANDMGILPSLQPFPDNELTVL
jgi:hypothetical protein